MKQFVFYTKGLETKSFYDEEVKAERYFVKGHIDSSDLDLVNDIVTKSCMEDMSKQINSKNLKLDYDHETLRKSKDENELDAKLNLTKIPLGKAISEELDSKGNLVEFELNPNWKKFNSKGDIVMTFQEVWQNIKSGFYDAFSIAYVPIKTVSKEINGMKARLLDQINLINVALTGNPINPAATMTNIMAKSLEYLEEDEESKMNFEEIKSELLEIKSLLKPNEVDTMTEETENKSEEIVEEQPIQEESKSLETEEKSEETEETEESEAPEEKSIDAKAFAELKSLLEEQKERIETLKGEIKSINDVLDKAVPKSKGAENKSEIAEQKSVDANTLSLIR